jgi:hypothetical protein
MISMAKQTKHISRVSLTTHMVFSYYDFSKYQPKKERMSRDSQRVSTYLPSHNNWKFNSQLIPCCCTRINTIGKNTKQPNQHLQEESQATYIESLQLNWTEQMVKTNPYP